MARSIQFNENLAYVLILHAQLAIAQGNYEQALGNLTEGLDVISRTVEVRLTADLMNLQGWLGFYQGHYDTAETFFLESLEKYPQLSARVGLVRVYLKLRRDDAVKKEMQEGLSFMRPQIEPYEKLEFLVAAADMYLISSRDNDAAEMIGLILGYPNVGYQTRLDAEQVYRELAVGKDSSVLEAALERGKSLDLDGVVARLLAELV